MGLFDVICAQIEAINEKMLPRDTLFPFFFLGNKMGFSRVAQSPIFGMSAMGQVLRGSHLQI